MAEGRVTRGTTGVNRLRRVDRYLQTVPALRSDPAPLVIDLGFGARPWTTLELADRLRVVRPDVQVLGLEIDRERAAAAAASIVPGVAFAFGGFELATDRPATIVRAMNVLRQYEEHEVGAAWARMASRLTDDGVLGDGTCDELGRVGSWVDVDRRGPQRFTVSLRLAALDRPGIVAERLPKALIHRNVPGERVHDLLTALDAAWARTSALSPYGTVQRFVATAEALREDGLPVLSTDRRIRLGELTVPWSAVAPAD